VSVARNQQTNTVEHIGTGLPGPIKLLNSNPDRIWFTLTTINSLPGVWFAQIADTGQSLSFFACFTDQTQQFMRRDFGSLVTGDVWVSDGSGNDTNATVIATEGVLVGEASQ
jgi:hypothetical protein